MSAPTQAELDSMTPMLRQYYELKQKVSDQTILFFRMGDFYEIFGDDAEIVAPLLELVLTSRERGDQKRIPFCGVPHHSSRIYWLKLLAKGYKVAIADQLEDPAEAKGLVRRDIVRTLTPGCVDDLEGLDQSAPNYLLAVYEEPKSKSWAAAVADLSTGELRLGPIEGPQQIPALVETFRPKEVLARAFMHEELSEQLAPHRAEYGLLVESMPEAILRDDKAQKELLERVFATVDPAAMPCGAVIGGKPLLAALLSHFETLQASLKGFMTARPLFDPTTMRLDETAMRDLEIFETVRRRHAEGSLFREVNRTVSPMGARLLRASLARPLLDTGEIHRRHDAVEALLRTGASHLTRLRDSLKHTPDLERLTTRIVTGSASPAELAKARVTLEKAQWVIENALSLKGSKEATAFFKAIGKGLSQFKNPLALLQKALVDSPNPLGSGSGVFARGYDAQLDKLVGLAESGESKLESYQQRLREETGITSLKVKNHKTFGLLIEVTKPNLDKVPDTFVRRQTMVNCERFVTDELRELGETLATAQEDAVNRETKIFQELLQKLGEHREALRQVASALAVFDLLQAFAWQAHENGYCRPQLSTGGALSLRGSRHPVVERHVGRHDFAPNDVDITEDQKHLLITGPNMAGKSTVMRQTALSAILNQIGSFVPAREASLPVFQQIFTRVGAADDLSRGQSTFMVEMAEAAHILRQAGPRSLVILDEVGRGTSTQDGLAIASAILRDLAGRVQCYSLFATHYHELVPLARTIQSVRVLQTEVVEKGGRIVFTHRLKEGASGSSYGLEVARIAGLPETVLEQAQAELSREQEAAGELEGHASAGNEEPSRTRAGATKPRNGSAKTGAAKPSKHTDAPLEARGLCADPTPPPAEVLRRLESVDVNRLTPLQALNFLADLQSQTRHGEQAALFAEEPCESNGSRVR